VVGGDAHIDRGSTNSVNSVPIDMPATTTRPIENRLAAPAPVAVSSGSGR
jgi:hypothetical protein